VARQLYSIIHGVSAGMCIMEDLEVLEYSGIFFSNPEYRILFRNNMLGVR